MSWHYSQALEAAYLGANSLDGAPCALWKSMPSAPDDSCSDKMKGTCHRSPFGMMFVPSMDVDGGELLKWYRAVFLVRTSVPAARAQESRESEADCGKRCRASLARWDRATCSWRTHQYSLLGDLELFSETWPRWGMMRDGECWELPTPSGVLAIRARITSAIESGFLRLPTPRVADGERYGTAPKDSWNRQMTANLLRDYVQRFPTPQSRDWKDSGMKQGGRHSPNLGTIVMQLEAQRYATPASSDGTRGGTMITEKMSGQSLRQQVGGPLNPEFHEWLMGWPIGWTASAPLATDRFRQWLSLHGKH